MEPDRGGLATSLVRGQCFTHELCRKFPPKMYYTVTTILMMQMRRVTLWCLMMNPLITQTQRASIKSLPSVLFQEIFQIVYTLFTCIMLYYLGS